MLWTPSAFTDACHQWMTLLTGGSFPSIAHEWELVEGNNSLPPYLATRCCLTPTRDAASVSEAEEVELEVELELEDTCVAIVVEYEIVYHPSFQCPTLYFRSFGSEGELLPLLELVQPLTPNDSMANSNLRTVSISHGMQCSSGRPSYFLHPCMTEEFMQGLTEHAVASLAWLQRWFSLVASLMHFPFSDNGSYQQFLISAPLHDSDSGKSPR